MIVPMKKVAIITQSKDAASAIKVLRSVGVVHVEHQTIPKGKALSAIEDDIALVSAAINILEPMGESRAETQKAGDWRFTARHIIDLQKRIEQLDEYSRTLRNRISQWEQWGDFDPKGIEELSKKNIYVGLYQIPVKELKSLPEGVFVKTLSAAGGIANCAVVSLREKDISYKELILPKMGLNKMRERLLEDIRVAESIKKEIGKTASYLTYFLSIRRTLENESEFQEVLNGMGKAGDLVYLTGYLPFDEAHLLIDTAKKEKWAFLISDPKEEDDVPTLLRNPAWVSLIRPVLKFLEILPGYKELDISLPFLVFFSIFFGILIGDAGYGLIYAVLTFLFQRRAKKRRKDASICHLFYILSFSAVLWGVLTGTFFGHEWLLKAGYKPLIPALANDKGVQRFCFFLGALHLSLAHGWRSILKFPSLSAISDAGWISILWAAFFIAKTLILGDTFPLFGKWLIVFGISMVIIFTNPQKNILKGIGKGLGALALSLMNNFTDVVSYIRLFAVGLAGVAIADAFNAMARLVGMGNIFAIIASVLIVLVGHTLGIVLGPVSVLVHGVRLNVLEFSGHANVSWSGRPFKPFKE